MMVLPPARRCLHSERRRETLANTIGFLDPDNKKIAPSLCAVPQDIFAFFLPAFFLVACTLRLALMRVSSSEASSPRKRAVLYVTRHCGNISTDNNKAGLYAIAR
jgi:hypothetical protein